MLKFVVMALCSASCAFGFQESNGIIARSLYEGNFRHLRAMHGLSFELSTTHSLDGSSYDALRKKVPQHFPETSFLYREPKDFKETFSIKFIPKDTVFPWRFRWTCDDPDEVPYEFLKQRAFYVVTDSACYSLMRPDWKSVRDRRYTAHEDFFQHLTAAAREIPLPLKYIQLDFASSYYCLIADGICANYLCGLQEEPFGKAGDLVEKSGPKINFERITKYGRKCFSLQTETKEIGYKDSMVILGGPDYMVIENQQWSQTVQGWKLTASFEAKELGVFNGVTYPKRGIVKKQLYKADEEGDLWLSVVEFTVDSVAKISPAIEQQWLPDLPIEGICYTKNNEVSCTPFSKKTRLSYFTSDLNPNKMYGQRSIWYWIRLAMFAGSIGLAALFLWRRHRLDRA